MMQNCTALLESYTIDFGNVFVGHTGRSLRVSSAHAAAAGKRGTRRDHAV